jgi:polyisoprenyl-teichoic acid--peptidoglycan teichoic acid transferase
VLGANVGVIGACLAAAVGLQYAYDRLGDVQRVTLAPDVLAPPATQDTPGTTVPGEPVPPPPAANFLVVGTDNRSCIDPDSPWAPAYLTGYEGTDSQLTDTIMVIRVDAAGDSSSILSLPRDLWVPLAGTNRKSKINAAYSAGPERLIRTINDTFGIPINHFVEVDFCAFRNAVDAVGGVSVPFEVPARDTHTGLGVVVPIAPGCHKMGGDEALAYARSRRFEQQDPATGRWREDPSSDLGRIRRQQDLAQRLLQKAIDRGARNPAVLNRLVDATIKNVVIDDQLTPRDIKELGEAMSSFEPGEVQTYTIESDRQIIGTNDVLVPRPDSLYNLSVALIFQGKALPALTPDFGNDTDAGADADTGTDTDTGSPTTADAESGATTVATTTPAGDSSTTSVLPTVQVPTTESFSLTPDDDELTCR